MPFQIVFRTSGFKSGYVTTIDTNPYVITSKTNSAYFTTADSSPIILSSNRGVAIFQTISTSPIVKTSGAAIIYVCTPDPNTPKQLKPKIGTLEFNGDFTIINVPDGTGEYNAQTNPGGYNVFPNPFNQYRPYRESVSLWTVYRIWDVFGSATQTPSNQSQEHNPQYSYALSLPTKQNDKGEQSVIKGIYEIILIAAPFNNQINSGGTYLSKNSTGTFYLIEGLETDFEDSVATNYYIYIVDGVDGDINEVGETYHVFSNTSLALTAAPTNTPVVEEKLYSCDIQISYVNSGGVVDSYTTDGNVYTLTGTGTTFTNFNVGDYVYIFNNGAYNELGQIDVIDSDTSIVFNTPNSITVEQGDFIVASATPFTLAEIQGTYAGYETGTIHLVTGTDTGFLTTAEEQEYLFYDNSGNYVLMGQIFKIFDDENVWLYEAPTGNPTTSNDLTTAKSISTADAEYANYLLTNLYDIAKELPGWYVTSVGIMVDDEVINCLNHMRYEYLQEVMCGRCPEKYQEFYAVYVGMLSAMEVQDWPTAIDFYNKLKTQCSEDDNSSCGC